MSFEKLLKYVWSILNNTIVSGGKQNKHEWTCWGIFRVFFYKIREFNNVVKAFIGKQKKNISIIVSICMYEYSKKILFSELKKNLQHGIDIISKNKQTSQPKMLYH